MTAHPVPIERASQAIAQWSDAQVQLIKEAVAPGCTDEFLAFFGEVCQRRELDPFAGEICAVGRRTKKKDHRGREYWETVHTIQVTVDGLRSIAERSGLYGGQDAPQWCGQDGEWRDVWLDETTPPAAARVAVYRLDWSRPVIGVARYASYVQLWKDDKTGEVHPKALWKTGPDFMLAKCAEAQALKRAFPRQLAQAGLAVREELSLTQRVAMEARQLGMGDDERHAMVAEITEGRTDSSREMTEGEALAMRERLAAGRIQAEAMAPSGVDPETGEIEQREATADPSSATSVRHGRGASPPDDGATAAVASPLEVLEPRPAASPPTSPPGPAERPPPAAQGAGTGQPYPEQRAREAWAQKEDVDAAMPSLKALEGDDLRAFRAMLGRQGIPQEAVRWTGGHLEAVVAWLRNNDLWRGAAPLSDFSEEPF